MGRVAAVGDGDQLGAREQLEHPRRERGELLVAGPSDQTDRNAHISQLAPVARLRAGAEMAEGARQPAGTVRQPLRAQLRGRRLRLTDEERLAR